MIAHRGGRPIAPARAPGTGRPPGLSVIGARSGPAIGPESPGSIPGVGPSSPIPAGRVSGIRMSALPPPPSRHRPRRPGRSRPHGMRPGRRAFLGTVAAGSAPPVVSSGGSGREGVYRGPEIEEAVALDRDGPVGLPGPGLFRAFTAPSRRGPGRSDRAEALDVAGWGDRALAARGLLRGHSGRHAEDRARMGHVRGRTGPAAGSSPEIGSGGRAIIGNLRGKSARADGGKFGQPGAGGSRG